MVQPILGVDRINPARLKLLCGICRVPGGACVQCCAKKCTRAFHPQCARENGTALLRVRTLLKWSNTRAEMCYTSTCMLMTPVYLAELERESCAREADGTSYVVRCADHRLGVPVYSPLAYECEYRPRLRAQHAAITAPATPVKRRFKNDKGDDRPSKKRQIGSSGAGGGAAGAGGSAGSPAAGELVKPIKQHKQATITSMLKMSALAENNTASSSNVAVTGKGVLGACVYACGQMVLPRAYSNSLCIL